MALGLSKTNTLDLAWIAKKGIKFFLKMQSLTYNIKARTF